MRPDEEEEGEEEGNRGHFLPIGMTAKLLSDRFFFLEKWLRNDRPTNGPTDRLTVKQTDQPTDKASYRDA